MLFRNKRGVSVLIGYVMLITFAIFMGAIVYSWIKTYVPKEGLDCPDDVSLFIKDYDCNGQEFNLTIKNNGKFNLGGYFIRVTDTPQLGLATIDISPNITSGGSFIPPSGVKFAGSENSLVPTYDQIHRFDISDISGGIYAVEILPLRWQEEDRKKRVVSCKRAIIREDLTCS